MCGIFGLIQNNPFDYKELGDISKLLRHRGPDDEGFLILSRNTKMIYGGNDTPHTSFNDSLDYCPKSKLPEGGNSEEGGIALGHRRLSILDLTSAGHQPMSYLESRYWISYNGEIYNYLELRDELLSLGYFFKTNSDTEVILAAYDCWGENCLLRFNGMWAFAIVDTKSRSLFLARDRFGIKPLYLYQYSDGFAFASEIKAFTALNLWHSKANKARLLDMLVWNVLDHSKDTMFDGVTQLLGGHFLKINLNSNYFIPSKTDFGDNLKPHKWYNLSQQSEMLSGKNAQEKFYSLITDSVKLCLRSDVPVGSCLSGGLDSSTLVCLMSDQLRTLNSENKVNTFTANSIDIEYDETKYSREVARFTGSKVHEITPLPEELFDILDDLTWYQDEPFLTTSIFAQWNVFKLARDSGIKVIIDGQGADEILCGYPGYFGSYLAALMSSGNFLQWYREILLIKKNANFSYRRSIGYTLAYLFPEWIQKIGCFDDRDFSDKTWIHRASKEIFHKLPYDNLNSRGSSVEDMSKAQIFSTNLPMLLHWEDRNSMAFSVEARVPFLDYRIVEFCIGLSDKEKIGGGISKNILRQSMRGVVPDLILDRKDKMGFVTAEKLWTTRDIASTFRAKLSEAVDRMPDILASSIIDQFDQVVNGKKKFDFRYWRAISAGVWCKVYDIRF